MKLYDFMLILTYVLMNNFCLCFIFFIYLDVYQQNRIENKVKKLYPILIFISQDSPIEYLIWNIILIKIIIGHLWNIPIAFVKHVSEESFSYVWKKIFVKINYVEKEYSKDFQKSDFLLPRLRKYVSQSIICLNYPTRIFWARNI